MFRSPHSVLLKALRDKKEPIIVDVATLESKVKITMIVPNVMDEQHGDNEETFSHPFLSGID